MATVIDNAAVDPEGISEALLKAMKVSVRCSVLYCKLLSQEG